MPSSKELQEARTEARALREGGHWAVLEEIYDEGGTLKSLQMQHPPRCPACRKEKEDG